MLKNLRRWLGVSSNKNYNFVAVGGENVIKVSGYLYSFDTYQRAEFDRLLTEYGDKPVTVLVDSEGGSITAAIGMYNALRNHKGIITTRNVGKAHSAATIIMAAGDVREVCEVSTTMIHNSRLAGYEGTASDLLKTADLAAKMDNMMAMVYTLRLPKASRKDAFGIYKQLMDNETYFNASETVAAGLADRVYSPTFKATNYNPMKQDQAATAALLARLAAAATSDQGDEQEDATPPPTVPPVAEPTDTSLSTAAQAEIKRLTDENAAQAAAIEASAKTMLAAVNTIEALGARVTSLEAAAGATRRQPGTVTPKPQPSASGDPYDAAYRELIAITGE